MMKAMVKNDGEASIMVPATTLVPGCRVISETAPPGGVAEFVFRIPPTNEVVRTIVEDWAVGAGATVSVSFCPWLEPQPEIPPIPSPKFDRGFILPEDLD